MLLFENLDTKGTCLFTGDFVFDTTLDCRLVRRLLRCNLQRIFLDTTFLA